MISSAICRCLNKNLKGNPFVGNMQYKGTAASPVAVYSSPYVGSVDHSKVFDYFQEKERKEKERDEKIKGIFFELANQSSVDSDWVKIITLR